MGSAIAGARGATLKKYLARPELSVLIILVVMLVMAATLQDNFFQPRSIVRNINAFAPLILLTMGQAVVIISGGIDLSTGSALSLLTCVLTSVMKRDNRVTGVYAIAHCLRRGRGDRDRQRHRHRILENTAGDRDLRDELHLAGRGPLS